MYNKGTDWSDAATSQRTPRVDGHHQNLGRDRGVILPTVSEEAWACRHLDVRLLASITVR